MSTMDLAQITTAHADRLRTRRDQCEQLLFLAQHLGETDRLLVEQVYQHRMSPAQIARLMGQPTRTVRARLQRILRHVRKPEYRFLVLRADLLSPTTRRVAELVIFRRMSLRCAARELRCTLHKVRQHMEAVQTLSRL
jgi:IS30 family transposase